MKTYEQNKARARHTAQEWQQQVNESATTWGELAEASAYFEKIGKRYGLLKEFRENGIL